VSTLSLPNVRLGAQRPRVHSGPRFSTSAGEEATALAAELGLFLDPWQAWVLEESLGERMDGKWAASQVCLLCPRQNGKGSVLEARELAGLFLFGEKKITHSAHEAKTSKDHFERMESLLRNAGYGDDKVTYRRSTTEVSILLHETGCKLHFFTRTATGGRGLGGDVVVLDEAFALTRDQMAALMPTMSARSLTGNPQMWFTSSAGFADSDVLSGKKKQGENGSDPRLAYFDWSADPHADVDDPEAAVQANPGLGIRISEEFVASELHDLGEERFARERLGQWADAASSQVISEDAWEACRDPDSRRMGGVVFAVDASTDRDGCSIAVAGLNRQGRTHVELVDWRPGVAWAGDRLVELTEKHNPGAVVVDSAGTAASLIPFLEAARVPLVVTGAQQIKQACGAFYDAVQDVELAHTGLEPRLNLAAMSAGKRNLGDAWAWKRRGHTDISPLVASTLAFYGLSLQSKQRTNRAAFY
jgi:hypothetical protein